MSRRMTELEKAAHRQVCKILNQTGYSPYTRWFENFALHLVDDPDFVGATDMKNGIIYLNKGLSKESLPVVVRHEILHNALKHLKREQAFSERDPKYKNLPANLANIAADYEISNRGYTDKDKVTARHISIADNKEVAGLVTDLDHPDWVDLPFEDMLELLLKEYETNKDQLQSVIDRTNLSSTIPQKDLDDEISDVEDALDKLDNTNNQDADQKSGQSSKNNSGADDSSDDNSDDMNNTAAGALKNELDDIKQDAAENKKAKAANGGPFESQDQKETDEEIQERLKKIQDALNNKKELDDIIWVTDMKVREEAEEKRKAEIAKYKGLPMIQFKDSLMHFIKNEIGQRQRTLTWRKPNKKYANSGFIKKGAQFKDSGNLPKINIYFDRSGSWDSEEKTNRGKSAISTLANFEKHGQIKLQIYYFSNIVSTDETDPGFSGGTYGQPILEHIKQTKPSNVIVITDSDITDCKETVVVPGGVWLLFYDGVSNNLIEHLHGDTVTKWYNMETS